MSGLKDTQKGLAKLLGVSEVMVWSYKNGEKLPRMSMALNIANKLGVSVQWLLQGIGKENDEEHTSYQSKSFQQTTQNTIDFLEEITEPDRKRALKLLQEKYEGKK